MTSQPEELVVSVLDGIDYSPLTDKEYRTKAVRDLYSIFYLNDNTPLRVEEIFDEAQQLGLLGEHNVNKKSDIVRNHIHRWNHIHDDKPDSVESVRRIVRLNPLPQEKKSRYCLEQEFAQVVKNVKNKKAQQQPDMSQTLTPTPAPTPTLGAELDALFDSIVPHDSTGNVNAIPVPTSSSHVQGLNLNSSFFSDPSVSSMPCYMMIPSTPIMMQYMMQAALCTCPCACGARGNPNAQPAM